TPTPTPTLRVLWVLMTLVAPSITGCAKMSSQATTLIEYHRSGGITGREDRLVVLTDGTARLSRQGAVASDYQVGADALTELRALLQRIDFRGMRDEYLPPRRGADQYEYVVIYEDRRIRTMDTAVPPELQPLIQLLSGLANRAR
ncbi:MAG: hypothetical protein ACREMW_12795, partial [Gemmatimonadales bacterium]